uniref:Envelope glycoprotein n=4 Tax=Koala retrovirus TaxID=394239 RepID=S6AWZ0_KORV|nr:envelope glycoprotein [Koala retrovirus]
MLLISNPRHLGHPMSPGNWKRLIILLSCVFGGAEMNPHRPMTLTWQVLSQTGSVVWEKEAVEPPWTWWPSLEPDVCALAAGLETWGIPHLTVPESQQSAPPNGCGVLYSQVGRGLVRQSSYGTLGCRCPRDRNRLAQSQFYVCPRDGRSLSEAWRCGGFESLYCKEWGCETAGTAYWQPRSSWDLITVGRGHPTGTCERTGWCNPLKIEFTEPGKRFRNWLQGRTWGLRFYETGHPGVQLTIRLLITSPPPVVVGPDLVLVEQGLPGKMPSLPRAPVTTPRSLPSLPTVQASPPAPSVPSVTTGDRLLGLVQGAFLVLNATNSEVTESCWLCLAFGPPYYEGIATPGQVTYTSTDSQCRWGGKGKLTLTEVSGLGLCIGTVPPTHRHLCSSTVPLNASHSHKYLLPSNHSWWACNSGLTPCLSTSVFNQSNDFCIQIQLVPRIYYHPDGTLLQAYESPHPRNKREPVSLTLAVLLGLGVAAGIGTGSTALIKGPIDLQQGLTSLQIAMDTDLRALQDSISKLEDSLTSLSEVALQNRRGLDLLFLKEGGLCAALKEECCFYVDHSGPVRDSMRKLKERLDKRQLEYQKNLSWYEGWFNRSPWLTTLMSALAGPLLLLLLILTLGPCVINKLVQFVNDRVSAVRILFLRHKYQTLNNADNL